MVQKFLIGYGLESTVHSKKTNIVFTLSDTPTGESSSCPSVKISTQLYKSANIAYT